MLQAALLSMDPKSGAIRAWIGGNHFGYNQYDHVHANRQVGSIFKPIVYAAAIQEGLNPCTYYPNEQIIYPEYEDWKPGNSDNIYGGVGYYVENSEGSFYCVGFCRNFLV
jgi:penicillin-binding protein 1A